MAYAWARSLLPVSLAPMSGEPLVMKGSDDKMAVFQIEIDEKMIASWRAEYAQECSAAAPGRDFKKRSEGIYGAFLDLRVTT